MKNKDIFLIFAMILLIGIIFSYRASAQSADVIKMQAIDAVLGARNNVIESPRTQQFAEYLFKTLPYGEKLFDRAFDNYDCSWFEGVDVYVHEDPQVILEAIRLNEEASFRNSNVSLSAVSVVTDGYNYLVLITSFP